MKKIICLLLPAIFFVKAHAQNTFPSSGNAGIGTTSPGFYALNIQGSNTDGGATNAPSINISNNSTFNPSGSGYNLAWLTLAAGNSSVVGQLLCNYGSGATTPFSGGSGLILATRTNHPIIFATGGSTTTERMRLTSAGNLGIGSTNPAGTISFADVTAATGTTGITWYSATGDPTMYGIHKTSGAWSAPNYQQIRIGWQTGIILDPGTAYGMSYVNIVGNGLRVTSGTVGIGTVSTNDATCKLFVEAGIRTRLVKVDQAVWPDYVFEPNYALRPLSKLKSFIQANKHLPEISSSEEIKQNGLDLGANQAALLKKIEELTLYVIAQDKKIQALEIDMAKMKKQKKTGN